MKAFTVNIIGLSLKAHSFEFTLNNEFFQHYGTEIIQGGTFEATVVLDKRETFIEADFSIDGKAHLICDRSLEPFDFPVKIRKHVVFKYGDEPGEVNDELIIISRDQPSLELGQILYELVALEIPMKKLHPKFKDTEDDEISVGKIVYTSGDTKPDDDEPIDPRWEILKKLK